MFDELNLALSGLMSRMTFMPAKTQEQTNLFRFIALDSFRALKQEYQSFARAKRALLHVSKSESIQVMRSRILATLDKGRAKAAIAFAPEIVLTRKFAQKREQGRAYAQTTYGQGGVPSALDMCQYPDCSKMQENGEERFQRCPCQACCYCSRRCQELDFPEHKRYCAYLLAKRNTNKTQST